jgi:hypothetical protein
MTSYHPACMHQPKNIQVIAQIGDLNMFAEKKIPLSRLSTVFTRTGTCASLPTASRLSSYEL